MGGLVFKIVLFLPILNAEILPKADSRLTKSKCEGLNIQFRNVCVFKGELKHIITFQAVVGNTE